VAQSVELEGKKQQLLPSISVPKGGGGALLSSRASMGPSFLVVHHHEKEDSLHTFNGRCLTKEILSQHLQESRTVQMKRSPAWGGGGGGVGGGGGGGVVGVEGRV